MPTNRHRDATDLAEPAGPADRTGARAAREDSVARRATNPKLPRILLLLALGGFLILIALMFWAPRRSAGVLEAIPNDALGALFMRGGGGLHKEVARFLPEAAASPDRDAAVLLLQNPFEAGIIAKIKNPDELLNFSLTAQKPYQSLGQGLVAWGSPKFAQAVRSALEDKKTIPWWIRIRLNLTALGGTGAMLWGLDQQKPWVIGRLAAADGALAATLPSPKEDLFALEVWTRDRLDEIALLASPQISTILLPDGSVAREIRAGAGADAPFSYERTDSSPAPCPLKISAPTAQFKVQKPAPGFIFSFSLLKKAVFMCIIFVDNL